MNFNFSEQPEYNLNTSLVEEVINLYGILTKFLVVQKMNKDDLVFGDYTHLKSDSSKIYDIYMLPENTEDWEQDMQSFNSFGLNNFENINLFCAKSAIIDSVPTLYDRNNGIPSTDNILGNLVVLPNNKIMEITSAMWEVPGVNNLFTYKDAKSVLKLSCKPYDNKLIQELDPTDSSVDPYNPYQSLDGYFQELIVQSDAQNTEAEVKAQVPSVKPSGTGGIDTSVDKPIVDFTEDNVWGNF